MIKKRAAKAPPNPYLTTASPDDLGPANPSPTTSSTTARRAPSVERIMNAGLDKDATLQAMTLFRDALATIGDPTATRAWRSPPARRPRAQVRT